MEPYKVKPEKNVKVEEINLEKKKKQKLSTKFDPQFFPSLLSAKKKFFYHLKRN